MEFANSPEELNELEAKYVTLKELYDEICYNLKTGGEQNIVFSDETIRKIRESQKGEKSHLFGKCGKDAIHYGQHHSDEAKRKMSEAKKGKAPWNKGKKGWMSDEGQKKMSELMKNNRYRRGAKHKIESLQKISKALKGRIWVTNGIDSKFVFEYEIPEGYRKGRIMKSMRGVK